MTAFLQVWIQNYSFSNLNLNFSFWRRPDDLLLKLIFMSKVGCVCARVGGWKEGMGGWRRFQPGSQQECSPHLSPEPRWDGIIKRSDGSRREEREAPTPMHALAEEEEGKKEKRVLMRAWVRVSVWDQSSGLKEGWWKDGPADQSLELTW